VLDEARARICRLNYSIRTEDTCVDWVRRFVFSIRRHPRDRGATEIEAFLARLAIAGKVSASIWNQGGAHRDFFIGRCLGLMSRG
jgi:hypothetical protein